MHKAKLNMLTTIVRQLMATLCGIVIPRVMIGAFGSTAYGATTSIAQFLSYISLLEAGIGRVARGALYRPLARGDVAETSGVYQAIKQFFRSIGFLFLIYSVILAFFYYDIAKIQIFSREYTFFLVIAIGLSTAATYFSGIANMTLMHADQKQYLTNTIITVTNLLNTVCIVLLVWLKTDILTVKLVSSFVFILRPLLYARHVKKHYTLIQTEKNSSALSQKWTGIGQHIAYFLHTNTDVVLLTVFADLKIVAVYSVYHLVVNSVWNIASSFSGGMEASFGEMIAKKEQNSLFSAYNHYKGILTLVALTLFGCTGILIIPFIRLYMSGIADANYIQPLFAVFLILSEFMNTLALPCTTLPVSANQLKRIRWGSYGEAAINLIVSITLLHWRPLLGVAIGTFCATVFKCIFNIVYVNKNILKRSIIKAISKFLLTTAAMVVMIVIGSAITERIRLDNFVYWGICGACCFVAVLAVSVLLCRLLYPAELSGILQKLRKKM